VQRKVLGPSELGARLRKLRLRAQLTQDEVADRMGLTYPMRKMTVMCLETGRTANPTVKTLGRFLRACGALWGEITDLLDGSEPVEIDTRPIKDSEFDVRDKQRLEWAVEQQVRKFETKLARPVGGKPLHPVKQAETVRKLRNYRMVANIIEQAVSELLKNKPVASIEYPRLKMIAREAVGILWRKARRSQNSKVKGQNAGSEGAREQGSQWEGSEVRRQKAEARRQNREEGESRRQKAEARRQNRKGGESRMQNAECRMQNRGLNDRLAEKAEYWETQKLDKGLVRDVQEVVVRRFAALQETNPELFDRLKMRTFEVSRLRD